MIKVQTFVQPYSVLTNGRKTLDEMQGFLNTIGQENIIHFTSSALPGIGFNHVIVYNDRSQD